MGENRSRARTQASNGIRRMLMADLALFGKPPSDRKTKPNDKTAAYDLMIRISGLHLHPRARKKTTQKKKHHGCSIQQTRRACLVAKHQLNHVLRTKQHVRYMDVGNWRQPATASYATITNIGLFADVVCRSLLRRSMTHSVTEWRPAAFRRHCTRFSSAAGMLFRIHGVLTNIADHLGIVVFVSILPFLATVDDLKYV